jgi:hypothetical protein
VIVVDASVWIDYFRDANMPAVSRLHALLGGENVAVGDLIVAEVLQGFNSRNDFLQARRLLGLATLVDLGGWDVAVEAAENYRTLRSMGITVRKTIDTLIATGCILRGHQLLHSDRDFDPFVKHLGLQSVL